MSEAATAAPGGLSVREVCKSFRLGDTTVRVSAELDRSAVLRNGSGIVHVEVSLKADGPIGSTVRAPTDVVVIVDHSGSMSGNKLYYAKQAIHQLIGRLDDEDRFGLVAYETSAQILIPISHATPWARKSLPAARRARF